MAVLTTSLTRLRNDFNDRFPSRDKASDGWIGDSAHEDTTSGHNPDESGGGEYEDSDSKDEVRAIDLDDDLRDSGGVTMQQVLDRIIATPRDIQRLKYMIYNRRIASRSNGWRWQTYTGSNPHDKHGHISGDPAYDEDAAEFTSVTQIGGSGMTPEEVERAVWTDGAGEQVNYRVQAAFAMRPTSAQPGNAETNQLAAKLNAMHSAITAVKSTVDLIATKVDIDPAELAAIQESAYQGALAGAADVEVIVAGILAGMEAAGVPAEWAATVEQSVRNVFADAGTPS
jgi:hypothetical protein